MAFEHIGDGERGYSLVETLVVAALAMTLMAMTVVQIGTSRATMNADNAMRLVMGEISRTRDMAIQQRRLMQISFANQNEVATTRCPIGLSCASGAATLLRKAVMEGNVRFALPAGTPDTNDAFGNGGALDFDGANPASNVCFNGDGMMVKCDNGDVINGTVFLAAPNDQYATRAVTVLGATGRVRGFRRLNSVWGRV